MFEEQYAEHLKVEEAEELFPEGITFQQLDTYSLVKRRKFVSKHALKKHLRGYCVKHNHQVKLSDSNNTKIRVKCIHWKKTNCPFFIYERVMKNEGITFTLISWNLKHWNLKHKCNGDVKGNNRCAIQHL